MKRAVVIVKGKVQRVAYRDFVEEIAISCDLRGFVENIKPYSVKIVCEGEEEKIKQFLEKIKNPPKPAEVRDITVKFEEARGGFEYFEIKRGEPMEELGERMDVAGKVLYEVRDLQKETIGLQKETIGSINNLSTNVDLVKTEIVDRFGSLGTNIEKILLEFQKDRKENREMFERLIKAVIGKNS